MRNNYKIISAKVTAGYSYYGSAYEIEITYEGCNYTVNDHVPMWIFKEKGVTKKNFSMNKVTQYLKTEEGKQFLSEYIYERDLKKENEEIESKIRSLVWNMDLEQKRVLYLMLKGKVDKENAK